MKPLRLWMVHGPRSLATFYGIYHTRRELVGHLDAVEPGWRLRGLTPVRVTVSPSEGRSDA